MNLKDKLEEARENLDISVQTQEGIVNEELLDNVVHPELLEDTKNQMLTLDSDNIQEVIQIYQRQLNIELTSKFKKKYRDEYVEARTDEETADIVLGMIDDISTMFQHKEKEKEIIKYFDLFDGLLIGDYPVDL